MEYIKCEKLDDYGRGIGYVDGKVIFVPDLLPEEEAYIDVILNKKKFKAHTSIIKFISA